MAAQAVYVRVNQRSGPRVFHNATCPKRGQKGIPSSAYQKVATPPTGARACRRCGG